MAAYGFGARTTTDNWAPETNITCWFPTRNGLSGSIAVGAGQNDGIVICDNNTQSLKGYAFGLNDEGQLGIDSFENTSEPVAIKFYAVTGVTLDKPTLSLKKGEKGTLTAFVQPESASIKNVSWASSDTSVATVLNGAVTAVGKGSATITATTLDGFKQASCKVTVTQAVAGCNAQP